MLKSKAAALIKLPTKKQLQPGCDFQKLVWSSKHFKLTTSLQPLNEKFLILAGKKHVVCKLYQGNIKEELQKTIKVTILLVTWAQNWNLHCQTHDFSCIIKSQSSYFWELHSLWSLSCYSLLYWRCCKIWLKLTFSLSVDAGKCWCFCLCSFGVAN